MDACVFCELITTDSPDLIAKEEAAVAFFPLPRQEIAPGHTLVVPRATPPLWLTGRSRHQLTVDPRTVLSL